MLCPPKMSKVSLFLEQIISGYFLWTQCVMFIGNNDVNRIKIAKFFWIYQLWCVDIVIASKRQPEGMFCCY